MCFIEEGEELVATNLDMAFTLPEGNVPAAGIVVRVIGSITGRKVAFIGKPSPYIFEFLFQDWGASNGTTSFWWARVLKLILRVPTEWKLQGFSM